MVATCPVMNTCEISLVLIFEHNIYIRPKKNVASRSIDNNSMLALNDNRDNHVMQYSLEVTTKFFNEKPKSYF